ncbi:MAG: putative hydrolase, partial [Phycisphaerales bacterium]|nr:putative hydrolase [Phycisphaerales bacterium]
LMIARLLHLKVMIMPELAVIAVFLWHFLLLGPATIIAAIAILVGRRRKAKPPASDATTLEGAAIAASIEMPMVSQAGFSRRDFLTRAVIALPPLAVVGLTGQSKWTEDDLIRRDMDVLVPNLPPALEGMTIAHVTDPHLGSFITDAKVKKIIEMTNAMDADVVLQTGDLINSNLADMPDCIDILRLLLGRHGVYSIQGNHDCFQVRDTFTADMKKAGVNLLVDEAADLTINGRRIRLIGLPWVGYEDGFMQWRTSELLGKTQSTDAFNILLAHHPHAFDTAAAAGIPLTLSGHTHGGQVALTRNIGVGPIMYRYWSGIYRKPKSTCVVSNGTGNWFPLRINVPCEVLKLTLRRA